MLKERVGVLAFQIELAHSLFSSPIPQSGAAAFSVSASYLPCSLSLSLSRLCWLVFLPVS